MRFAKAQIKRIIKKSGAKRVSKEAVLALSQLIEDKALELTAKAITFAKYAGRRTLKKSDFELTQLK
ncbi:MAG: NFYB/HAP3 family transcription factor subunit [Candidatus Thermoplasmatota archaeon]|nr:NFYB/HAP3 family transcription factor subunit [Candidatus Thermoplasmatota archaeon]MDI6855793.1 NFYB/HAP3 family transcription factor subunit [Candidatus Thermoplasmatota archaeon]